MAFQSRRISRSKGLREFSQRHTLDSRVRRHGSRDVLASTCLCPTTPRQPSLRNHFASGPRAWLVPLLSSPTAPFAANGTHLAITMPPKMSVKERAQKMQAKGMALSAKADYLLVTQVLKARPDLVQQAKDQFTAAGIIDIYGAIVESMLIPQHASPAKTEDADDPSSVGDENTDAMMEVILHRNFNQVMDIPPKYLKVVFHMLEPTSMSRYAIKALVKRGCKEPPKQVMAEYWEFMTDCPGTRLLGNMRKVGDIVEWAQGLNEKNGRRLRDAVLPLDWASQGFYSVSREADTVKIFDRFFGKSVLLPVQMDGDPELSIVDNFSKFRATLWGNGTQLVDQPIHNLSLEADLATAAPDYTGDALKRKLSAEWPDKTPDKRTKSLKSPMKPDGPSVLLGLAPVVRSKTESESPSFQSKSSGGVSSTLPPASGLTPVKTENEEDSEASRPAQTGTMGEGAEKEAIQHKEEGGGREGELAS